MLEILTLCKARNNSTCMAICAFRPKYKWATVLYSTFASKTSLPRILDIVSIMKREANTDTAPNRRKEIIGLGYYG